MKAHNLKQTENSPEGKLSEHRTNSRERIGAIQIICDTFLVLF